MKKGVFWDSSYDSMHSTVFLLVDFSFDQSFSIWNCLCCVCNLYSWRHQKYSFKLLWEGFKLQSCLLYEYYFIHVCLPFWIYHIDITEVWTFIFLYIYQLYVFRSIFCLFFIRTKKVVLIEICILHFATQNSWFWI